MIMIRFLSLVLVKSSILFLSFGYPIDATSQSIDTSQLRKYVYYLASEELQGRGTGQEGEKLSADFIASEFMRFGLKPIGNEGSYFHSFEYKYSPKAHASDETLAFEGIGINVVAYLDNSADMTIVIGAHYDHLGTGEFGNSRETEPVGKVHYGADDNASGVAGVLALADFFANNARKESYNIIFICFSAEEFGLIGSKKFVQDATYDLAKVNYMINMDMIGRLDYDTRKLMVFGTGTAAEWDALLSATKHEFQLSKDSSGTGPSDHTSFYLADIPVLSFFSGIHSDYHTTADTPDKINYRGQAEILQYIVRLIEASEDQGKLTFQKTAVRQSESPRFKVTLGVMPDYSWPNAGLKLDGVTEGRAAQLAGIKAGDLIMKIGEIDIQNIQDYMKILSMHEKGDKVDAIIIRNNEKVNLSIEF
jgi:hypothetical protein